MIHPYTYKIVDKLTGEFYIGSRHQNVTLKLTPEEDFFKRYFSSGKFKQLIKENPSRFEGSIIFRSGEPEAAYWYEQLLIRENIKDPRCINRHYIDPDTYDRKFSTAGMKMSAEARLKISEKRKGFKWSDEDKAKMSLTRKGNQSPMKGKNHSDDTKTKMSIVRKGQQKSDETKRKISEARKGCSNPRKGMKISEEHRQNIIAYRNKVKAIDIERIRPFFDRYMNGESLREIAVSYGKSYTALYKKFILHFSTEMKLRNG